MARLLADASLLAGKEFKMGNFADIIEAIHVIQESMGITGTTAKEASDTINGSIASWKSALDNLLTGIGRNENIDQLVDNLVASTEDVIANLVPAIRRASEGFMQVMRVAVVRIGPQVLDAFRDIWNNKLPGVLTSAANGIIDLINDLFGTNIPKIETIELPSWGDISAKVILWAESLRNHIRTIAKWTIGIFTAPTETATEMTATFTTWWEETAKPAILSISTWVLNLFGMPKVEENTIKAHVGAWWSGIVTWVQNACVWTLQIFGFAPDAAETAVLAVKRWFAGVIKTVGSALTLFFNWASGMDAATLQGEVEKVYEDAKALIGQTLEFAWSLVPGPIQEKLQPLVDGLSEWWKTNEEKIIQLLDGINDLYNFLIGTAAGMFSDALSDEELWASVGEFLSSFVEAATAIAEALAPVGEVVFSQTLSGIKDVLVLIKPLLDRVVELMGWVKPIMDKISPIFGGFHIGPFDMITDAIERVTGADFGGIFEKLISFAGFSVGPFDMILNAIKKGTGFDLGKTVADFFVSSVDWAQTAIDSIAGAISELWNKVKEALKDALTIDWDFDPPTIEDVAKAIKEVWDKAIESLGDLFTIDFWIGDKGSGKGSGKGNSNGSETNSESGSGETSWMEENLVQFLKESGIPGYAEDSGIDAWTGVPGSGGGGKPGARTEDVVTELETVKGELQGLRADLIAAVNSLANRPIAVNGKIITDIVGQGILRKARATFG